MGARHDPEDFLGSFVLTTCLSVQLRAADSPDYAEAPDWIPAEHQAETLHASAMRETTGLEVIHHRYTAQGETMKWFTVGRGCMGDEMYTLRASGTACARCIPSHLC